MIEKQVGRPISRTGNRIRHGGVEQREQEEDTCHRYPKLDRARNSEAEGQGMGQEDRLRRSEKI